MSAKAPPEEDDHEYAPYEEEEDDDDDDDEGDFVPGAEEEVDDEEDEVVPILDGQLSLDTERRLHYQGDGFHLTSSSAVTENLVSSSTTSMPVTIEMVGPCDIAVDDHRKPTPRRMQVTWSQSSPASKSDDDSKIPAVYYQVHGRQVPDESAGEELEFRGGYEPVAKGSSVNLVCQARIMPATAKPAAVAVAAVAAAAGGGDDDDDDEDEDYDDADDAVDVEELIALQQDAGMSVDDLRKRYHAGNGQNGESESSSKKPKAATGDDDDDSDFDGF